MKFNKILALLIFVFISCNSCTSDKERCEKYLIDFQDAVETYIKTKDEDILDKIRNWDESEGFVDCKYDTLYYSRFHEVDLKLRKVIMLD